MGMDRRAPSCSMAPADAHVSRCEASEPLGRRLGKEADRGAWRPTIFQRTEGLTTTFRRVWLSVMPLFTSDLVIQPGREPVCVRLLKPPRNFAYYRSCVSVHDRTGTTQLLRFPSHRLP